VKKPFLLIDLYQFTTFPHLSPPVSTEYLMDGNEFVKDKFKFFEKIFFAISILLLLLKL